MPHVSDHKVAKRKEKAVKTKIHSTQQRKKPGTRWGECLGLAARKEEDKFVHHDTPLPL